MMIITPDQIFVLLNVANDGGINLKSDRLVDLLELVGSDLVEVDAQRYNLTARGRQVLADTSHPI